MYLSELKTGEQAVIVKVNGHGGFRKRLIEMGFISGKKVKVILNAPLKDPIEYEIIGYKISLRREEAEQIEVISEEEAKEAIATKEFDEPVIDNEEEEQQQLDEMMSSLAEERHHVIRVALVGNPNCGKTSLFNVASGGHEHVGNYSGVTVDAKEGRLEYKQYKFVIVDLPGTYSLSAYSPEELYVRKNLIEKMPDVVVNVVDASNIERNLYLTTQIIDMNLRVVMALNMYDELEAKGDELDIRQLGYLLGMPVCPTVSRDGRGINELFDTIIKIYEHNDPHLARHIHINHGEELEKSINHLKSVIQVNEQIRHKYSTRFLTIKYLENDSEVDKLVEELPNNAEIKKAKAYEDKRIEGLLHSTAESAIVDAKYAFIQGALAETYKPHIEEKPKRTITDKIDAIVTNKWIAFPVFIAILYLIFQATFTLGNYPMLWIEWLVEKIGMLAGTFMKAGWLKDLITDGIIGGVGSVLVFLPNILILYFFISLMEDSGYMSRAAFIMDKLMHKIGLHGKSFIPMIMGFGCNVPAIMATRTIENRKSKLITMAIIPFMSCSGRLPIFILLSGIFFGSHAALVLLGIYLLGIVMAIISAKVMSKFVKDDDLPFVMELPPYRVPTGKAIFRHTWEKGKQYLEKMATTILLFSILIWFLGYFPNHNKYGSVREQKENSYIGYIGKGIEPIMEPLGFNWKMGVGILSGIGAKELIVSTMGVMYSGEGQEAGADETTVSSGKGTSALPEDTSLQRGLKNDISTAGALAYMVFILLYFPCIATFIAIKNESGGWKWAIGTCIYTIVIAWIMAFATYHLFLLF
ncbi:MAG: ferrous iron transport protein B [Bacteroidales bacterium]|jgi:ferrous iron transport protein B|nr:ferrous iron transport protein B [Bacteroidales bacterium]